MTTLGTWLQGRCPWSAGNGPQIQNGPLRLPPSAETRFPNGLPAGRGAAEAWALLMLSASSRSAAERCWGLLHRLGRLPSERARRGRSAGLARGARGAGGLASGATRSPQAGDDPDSQDPALKPPPPRHPSPPGPRALLWGARWRGEGAGARESPPRKKARVCLSETPPAGGRKTRASRLRAEPGPRLLDLCPGQAFGLGYKLRLHTGEEERSTASQVPASGMSRG